MRLMSETTQHQGFTYIEVMIAIFILVTAIGPAMEALQSGMNGSAIHQSLSRQHYAMNTRMESVLAQPYGQLLVAAELTSDATTATSYSDPAGQADRVLVYLAVYDADADPFTLIDPNSDLDNNIYTGDASHLMWVKVEVENSALSIESLISR